MTKRDIILLILCIIVSILGLILGFTIHPLCFCLLISLFPLIMILIFSVSPKKQDHSNSSKLISSQSFNNLDPNNLNNFHNFTNQPYKGQSLNSYQPFVFDYPFSWDEIKKITSLIQKNELAEIQFFYPQLSHLNIAIIAEYIVGLMVNNYLKIPKSSLNKTMRTKLTYDYLPHQTAPGNMSDFMYINHQTKQVIIVETTTYRRVNSIINNEVNPITRHLRDLLQVNPTLNTYHIKVILVSPFSGKFSFFNNNSSKQDIGWLIKSFKNNIYPILSQFNYQHSFEDVLHYFSFTDLNNPNNISSLIINPPVFNQSTTSTPVDPIDQKKINLNDDSIIYL